MSRALALAACLIACTACTTVPTTHSNLVVPAPPSLATSAATSADGRLAPETCRAVCEGDSEGCYLATFFGAYPPGAPTDPPPPQTNERFLVCEYHQRAHLVSIFF